MNESNKETASRHILAAFIQVLQARDEFRIELARMQDRKK